jgi:putative transcriptional regulator
MANLFYNKSNKELLRRCGERLKSLRLEANISQTDLAKKTGLSRSSIAEIEKGRNFSMITLLSIARTFEFLGELAFFFKEEELELSPMEIYKKEKQKRKRGDTKNDSTRSCYLEPTCWSFGME